MAWEALAIRGIDVILATPTLIVLSPIMVVLAILIRLTSPGPALFRQERVGQTGRTFTMYKFRTMRTGASDAALKLQIERELRGEDTSTDGSYKLPNGAEVTRIGALLRRTSLDELPQLINVVRGEMTLVGPRPCLPWEAEMFPTEYNVRFDVKPGVTGLWQVSGRSTMNTLEMLQLDVEYCRSRSIVGDISILVRTLPAMLRRDGAR